VSLPPGREESVIEATPPVTVADPMLLPLTKNCTAPVGVPPDPVTVAVKVTVSPKFDGFLLEMTVVVAGVRVLLTVWLKVPVLVAKLASPL